jgi:hypothetical protein
MCHSKCAKPGYITCHFARNSIKTIYVPQDGVCCVVGSCVGGFDKETNLIGDIIYTNTEIRDNGENGKLQYFWEAFPVEIGRNGKEPGTSDVKTTYMFTTVSSPPTLK